MASSPAASTGQEIVNEARSLIGIPYLTGGKSRTAVDCSGFVWLVYANVGREYSYRNTATFSGLTEFVETSMPEDGDVVLFKGHMGIYDGGKVISAQSGARKVMKGELNWFGGVVGYYSWNG